MNLLYKLKEIHGKSPLIGDDINDASTMSKVASAAIRLNRNYCKLPNA